MTVRIGLGTISGQLPWNGDRSAADTYADILRLARSAEELGFDSLWVSEHHGAPDWHLPSPIVMLAAVAAVTHRIQLGTGIAIAPFQHPIRFAEDCAVVDQLSRGRLIVGLGGGWRSAEFSAFGVPMSERVGRTIEVAKICRTAWDRERFSFHGDYYRFEDAKVTPRPYGVLPLVMGGSVPKSAGRAGRLADGYLAGPQSDLAVFSSLVEAFDAGAVRAGRDPGTMFVGVEMITWVSEDGRLPPAVREAMWHKMGTSLQVHGGGAVAGSGDLPPIDDDVIDRRAFVGDPDQLVARMAPWVEAFGDRDFHILMRVFQPGLSVESVVSAMQLLSSDVLPRLRRIAVPEEPR